MPLRIGIFAPYDLARTGGVNNQIRSQARALRRLGHDVSVYGPASGPLGDGEVALCRTFSIHVSGTESSLGIDPTSFFRVSEVLSSNRFDVVHVHEPLTPLMPWFVLARAQAPIVGTFHVHREHGHPFYPIGRPFLALLMRRLSYRIAVSEAARQTIARYFPGDYDIVPNGIDADEFRRPQARPQLVASDRRHVLYVGRLEPRKGADHLIRAMADVQRRLPAVLTVVGDGPDRGALERLASSLNVDVRFAGRVSDEDLPAFFQWSDVVCSPAMGGESFGIVLLEAMVCRKPIVASRIDGYVGLIGESGSGVLVPPGDRDALSGALLPLLEDAEARRVMGERGAVAARQYDWAQLGSRLTAIYQRLLARADVA